MPSISTETVYEVTADFESAIILDFTVDEFRENGKANGLDRDRLIKRQFIISEDCSASRRGYTVDFKAKQKITDVGLAWALIDQGSPLIIRDTLLLKKGDILPDELGAALAAEKHPVKATKKKVEADAE